MATPSKKAQAAAVHANTKHKPKAIPARVKGQAEHMPTASASDDRKLTTILVTESYLQNSLPNIQLLHRFVNAHPDFVPGDDMGTSLACIGTVLVSSIILGTRAPQALSYLTSYPVLYIAAVFNEFDRQELWMSETWREKVGASLDDLQDIYDLQSWVEALSEEYWNNFWTPKGQIHLDALRAKALFGGNYQSWADNEALEFFGLQ